MTALVETRLGELAAGANREHLACEAAYGTAIEHAFRAGEHLLAAKAELAHGDWMTWVEENFVGADRTARAYMQLAGEPNRQRVADSSVREALSTLAVPRERDSEPVDAEVVDAEPEAEAPRSVVDMLRESGDLDEMERELEEEEARLAQDSFPRAGVEATTVRQVRESLRRGERMFVETMRAGRAGFSDWSCGQGLAAAATQYRDVADALAELAKTLDRKAREV